MAKRMGLGIRAYQGLEADPTKVKPRHQKLASMAALEIAHERNDPRVIPVELLDKIREIANIDTEPGTK